jgi:hypothetical protein
MTIAAWLVAMVGPLVARVLLSLGLSMVTVTGAALALSTVTDQVKASVNTLPAEALAIGGLLGCWQAIGIICGALTFSVTWRGTSGFWKLVKQ